MKNFLKIWFVKNKYLLLILFGALILYFPSFNVFFTNDDFFHLKISNIKTFAEFLNFFNFVYAPEGFGFYRPLTTQVFYFLGIRLFNLNPTWLHILSFLTFSVLIFLLYRFTYLLIKNKSASLLASFLYAFSAIHFGHLYFLGTFQELGMAVFVLSACIYFVKFLQNNSKTKLFLSILFYVLGLVSKETAVMFIPAVILVYLYLKLTGRIKKENIHGLISLSVFLLIITGIYLYFHFFLYGIAKGDSYFTDFGIKKTLNSLFWYFLWSWGLPEMLVDFVGSGLTINPNLFKFWKSEFTLIFSAFLLSLAAFLLITIKTINRNILKDVVWLSLFSVFWFVIFVLPVLFFPFHKFSYNLTLSAISVFMFAGWALVLVKSKTLQSIFLFSFIILNLGTLSLTEKTHWISEGSETAHKLYNYFEMEKVILKGKTVVFYDSPDDSDLPWSPTKVVEQVLSGNNFFEVFYPNLFDAKYNEDIEGDNIIKIKSRGFLGY